ncbi:MAG: hypothetical protein V1793_07205 [Pseudomonadota bacterium]
MKKIPAPQGIRFFDGPFPCLVVAPHGPVINGEYQNDIRTGVIAEAVHHALGCKAIINDRFFKPKGNITKSRQDFLLDLFRIDHAGKVPGLLEYIRDSAFGPGKTLVLWVHGISDTVALSQAEYHTPQGLFDRVPEDLHALIGYGQGGDPKTGEAQERLSARRATVDQFARDLTQSGMITLPTAKEASNFRGRDAKRLNQWFNHLGLGPDRVESLQLEIREKDFRDSESAALKTAAIIAGAIKSLLETWENQPAAV